MERGDDTARSTLRGPSAACTSILEPGDGEVTGASYGGLRPSWRVLHLTIPFEETTPLWIQLNELLL